MRGNEHNLKRMFSVMVVGIKRIFAFVAITLVATNCFAGDEKPKLMPLPPIAPGLQLSRVFNDHMVLQRDTKVMPIAARFGWSSRPYLNLWTASGLPVGPFRTDDWPMR